jgi:ribosome-associated heat shock protein Hsp15
MSETPAGETLAGQRLDKWLWCARFFKGRSLAAELCQSGRLRLSGRIISKAGQTVRPGDVLTFPLGAHIRVVRVLALAERRGPAPEARALYDDLAPILPPADDATAAVAERERGAGRPTKAQRRAIDRLTETTE